MQHEVVSFNVANLLNKHHIIIDSKYCYCISPIGVRIVKGNPEKPEAERIYHRETIECVDEKWGITYPSENWCSCPHVFDVICYLDEKLDIVTVPIYSDNKWGCKVIKEGKEIINKEPFVKSMELMFKSILDDIIKEIE